MMDCHVHTSLCGHAGGKISEYIEKAIANNLKSICFLDHLTLRDDRAGLSMRPAAVGTYYFTLDRLRLRYEHRIRIAVGLEVDYNPDRMEEIQTILNTYDFDAVGGSLHFVSGINVLSRQETETLTRQEYDAVFEAYMDLMHRMVEQPFFDILCHIDAIAKFGRRLSPDQGQAFDRLLERLAPHDIAVEVNTSGYSCRGWPLPGQDLIRRCCEYGIDMTLGADAHHPNEVGRHFTEAAGLISACGHRRLTGFSKRKKIFYPISLSDKDA